MPDRRRPTFDVPDQDDAPVVWDPQARAFVPVPAAPGSGANGSDGSRRARRQWFVGPEAVGKPPPPRLGSPRGNGDGGATAVHAPPAPAPPAGRRPDTRPRPRPDARPRPEARPRPGARPRSRPEPLARPGPADRGPGQPRTPAPAEPPRRRFPLPLPLRLPRLRRPKLRWILALVGLVPFLALLGGWWYANHLFGQVERIAVGEVLDPLGGGGTNYLIVGSDSREVVAAAGADDPNVQPGGAAPAGERSDTILLLRVEPDASRMLSIPRDLLVTNPASGEQGRINATYGDGPANLIRAIQQNLDIPVHRYIEVDFVTFSSLVDALGGITLGPDVVPHPAVDERSGLNIGAGPVELDGQMALAFVRSRHYTELVDGREVTDPTGDLGRVARQQAFLRTVLAKAGNSRNPITLLRVASSVTGGLRIDDEMSLLDAVRFAWNMGRLDPESVVLPTTPHRTSGGAAVLLLEEETADAALEQFR